MLMVIRHKLTPERWERVLSDQRPYTKENRGWSKQLLEEPLTIDMSRVSWIEPNTLLRVVLFIEGGLLEGINIELRLPRSTPTRAEASIFRAAEKKPNPELRQKASYIAHYVRRRQDARKSLNALRLLEALKHSHLLDCRGQLLINEDHDWSSERFDLEASSDEEIYFKDFPIDEPYPWYFGVAYGLRWIPSWRKEEGRKWIEHFGEIDVLSDVLLHGSRRVAALDGRLLAEVFLKELVENTIDHSGRDWALIAAWSRPARVSLRENEVYGWETHFADACNGYPLLEISVGDSGGGLPDSLRSAFRKEKNTDSQNIIGVDAEPRSRSEDEKILAWSFGKWSTRNSEKRRGTRGLYRVDRVVKKYEGMISVRSELSYFGKDYLSNNPISELYPPSPTTLARSPGTIIHVRLPVMPIGSVLSRPAVTRSLDSRMDLKVVDLQKSTWSDTVQSIEFVRDRLTAACKPLSLGASAGGVIADFGFAEMSQPILADILRTIAAIAHPVAVIVTNIKRPSGDACQQLIQSLWEVLPTGYMESSSALTTESAEVPDPILYRYPTGEFEWIDIDPERVKLLQELWAGVRIPENEIRRRWPLKEERANFLRHWRQYDHVVSVIGENLQMTFNQQDVEEALHHHLQEQFTRHIENSKPPVVFQGANYLMPSGKNVNVLFRTPSLEKVFRFVRIPELISQLGLDRCMTALAQRCQEVVDWEAVSKGKDTVELVADARTSRILLEALKPHLEATLSKHSSLSKIIINQFYPGDPLFVGENSVIVLFMDVLSSGNLMNRLLAQLRRAKRAPDTIIAILENSAPSFSNFNVNVVTLVSADLSMPTHFVPEHIINISPDRFRPEAEDEKKDTVYSISNDRFVKFVEEADALYFDHIVRPNGRHFCFYLDALKMLGTIDTADRTDISVNGASIIDEYIKIIDIWRLSDSNGLDAVFYPEEGERSVGQVIAFHLREHYGALGLGIGSVTSNDWRPVIAPAATQTTLEMKDLFALVPTRKAQSVVVVDWGSLTGHNVRNMIRLAAEAKITRLLVIIFLSQLSRDEEEALLQLRTVSSTDKTSVCYVEVHFLARFPVRAYDSQQCPHCQQLRRLDAEESQKPPDFLLRYINDARRRLRYRFVEDLRQERQRLKSGTLEAITRIDGTVGQETTSSKIRSVQLRDQLEAAQHSTHNRHQLAIYLDNIIEGIREGDDDAHQRGGSVIRLLAAEWTWLKQEPLSLPSLRQRTADLAASIALNIDRSEDERRDAIVVLRTASKERFANYFLQLFEAVLRYNNLLPQLIYAAFTYLHREYLERDESSRLVDKLKKCRDLLNQSVYKIPAGLKPTISRLISMGEVKLSYGTEGITKEHIWHLLRTDWINGYERHHYLAEVFTYLRPGFLEKTLINPEKPLPEIDWHGIDGQLKSIEPALLEIFDRLQYLQSFFDEIAVTGVAKFIGIDNLAETCSRCLNMLQTQLDAFASEPTIVRLPGQWDNYTGARDWLWETVLKPGRKEGDRRIDASPVITLLQDCPCNIYEEIAHILPELAGSDVRVKYSIRGAFRRHQAFCDRLVLRSLLHELFTNVQKYGRRDSNNKIELVIDLDEEIRSNDEGESIPHREVFVCLYLTNYPASMHINSPNGLNKYKQYIGVYDADLQWSIHPQHGKFEVKAAFRLWTEGGVER